MSKKQAAPQEQPLPLAPEDREAEQVAYLSQWQLVKRRFRRHRLAVLCMYALIALYAVAVFAEFFAPYRPRTKSLDRIYSPPQVPRLSLSKGLHVRGVHYLEDPVTLRQEYLLDKKNTVPLRFFVKGEPYKIWGLIPWDRHFIGSPAGSPRVYILGADKYGQCLLSRLIYGSRISLSIGLVGITIASTLGISLGGISGYAGGAIDTIIQRTIEIVRSFPSLPLWMALGAALPADWSPLKTYFSITVILSLLNWTGLARVVRGKLLSLREEDYAVAARLLGASHARIIFRHLLPGFTSYIIVRLTLMVPAMILGETALSFLGLGLRPPVVSWGVMLQDAMSMQAVANYPWLLMPAVFIIFTVLCFNYMGDGLRDAADPYH